MKLEPFDTLNNFADKRVFFIFSGPLTQDLMSEMGNIIKNEMQKDQASLSNICKVFSLLVEQTQNIVHYSEEIIGEETKTGSKVLHVGTIEAGYADGHYYVMGGNRIKNTHVDRIKEKIEAVTSMNKEELKQYYREQRKKNPDQESKGAGLGFIEIARKTTTPISYNFTPMDQTYSYFSIKSEI